ncbi:bacteriophage transcriptional regulator [Pasteurella multocida subsp. gallicida str. Anand1_poultry]|nr:bacteriophage transcriptional regulator [Pasteurella multocida subsp. gallicida str. Anand1_poultry]
MMSTNADIFDEKAPEILADLAKHIETQLLAKVKSDEFNSDLAKQIWYRGCNTCCSKLGR